MRRPCVQKGHAYHVARARDRVAIVVKPGGEVRHRRVAMFFATGDGVALQQAGGVAVRRVKEVRSELLRYLPTRIERRMGVAVCVECAWVGREGAYRNVVLAAPGAVHRPGELACEHTRFLKLVRFSDT